MRRVSNRLHGSLEEAVFTSLKAKARMMGSGNPIANSYKLMLSVFHSRSQK